MTFFKKFFLFFYYDNIEVYVISKILVTFVLAFVILTNICLKGIRFFHLYQPLQKTLL